MLSLSATEMGCRTNSKFTNGWLSLNIIGLHLELFVVAFMSLLQLLNVHFDLSNHFHIGNPLSLSNSKHSDLRRHQFRPSLSVSQSLIMGHWQQLLHSIWSPSGSILQAQSKWRPMADVALWNPIIISNTLWYVRFWNEKKSCLLYTKKNGMTMGKMCYCRTANVRVAPNIRFIRALYNARIIDAANMSWAQCALLIIGDCCHCC